MADFPHHCPADIAPAPWLSATAAVAALILPAGLVARGRSHGIMQRAIVAFHREEPVAILFQHHRFRLPHYGMDSGEIRGAVEVRSRRGPCVSCFSRSLEVLCRAVKVFVHVWNRRQLLTCAFPRCVCHVMDVVWP